MHRVVQLVRGRGQARHHLAGGERQDVRDRLPVALGDPRRRLRVPARVVHRLDQRPGPLLGLVGGGAGGGRLVQAQRLAQPGQRRGAAPDLAGPQDRQDQAHPGLVGRGRAQHVQAVADLRVLHLAEPAVDMEQEVVEPVVVRPGFQAQVVVELGGLDQRPDLRPDRRELGGVHRGDRRVLVEQLLQARDVAVALRAGHRRHQVVDEGGVHPALGLGALARVVDEEGVDQRQVTEGRVGAAGRREARVLAGQPLQVAVLAQVHHGVGAETAVLGARLYPAVGGQVVVGGRQVRVVVDRDRVLAEAARRLDQDQQPPEPQRRQDDVALRVAAAVDEHLAGRRPPVLLDLLAQLGGERAVPAAVVGRRDTHRVAGQLLLGQPVLVVAARLDQRVDQLVAVARLQPGDGLVAEVVPLGDQPPQQSHRARRGVQPHRVADPGVLRRVRGEDQGQALLGVGEVAQARVAHRGRRPPGRRARCRRRRPAGRPRPAP